MDNNAFDNFTKSIVGFRSRRGMLRAVAVAAGAAAVGEIGLGGRGTAATCRPGGSICTSNDMCCSGACQPKDTTGRQRCGCESGTTPCGTDHCCSSSQVCVSGACRQPTPTAT